jgi:glutaredoxin
MDAVYQFQDRSMRFFFKYFFKIMHWILGPLILLGDWITTPRGLVRTAEAQQQVDASTENLVLYQFKMCPFSVKVRRAIKRLSLNIETRDALRKASSREELIQGGGEIKVPCLRITAADGATTWMYESDAIIDYLQDTYA